MEKTKLDEYCGQIKAGIEQLGICKGDVLYVSSNITIPLIQAQKDLNFRDKESKNDFLNALIDTIKQVVGEEGTVLFPVYNWDFCKGVPFDYKTTKGKVGSLNNFVLENRSDFRRTRHPLYSFMVWGKDSDYLCSLDNQEAFGSNSVFAYLDRVEAKEMALGVDMAKGFSFFHYLEQLAQVPYRYHKIFLGEYTDENNRTEIRAYSQYVRRMEIEYEDVLSDDFLTERAGLKKLNIKGWQISMLEYKKAKTPVMKDLQAGAAHGYHFGNYAYSEGETSGNVYEVGALKDYQLI
jgi:aminoglycoside 3-N-acetyltransferase